MNNKWKLVFDYFKIILGCAIFGLGLDLFLLPNDLNAGGLSGLSMIIVHLMQFSTVGVVTAVINLPLFILGGWRLGKKFVVDSLIGMILTSVFIDLFANIPQPDIEPLISALYGGVTCGAGLGLVFASGGTTGGSDIIVRFLKLKWQHLPIGIINTFFDMAVAILTGIVFRDINCALYSGIAIFVCGQVIDAVVYRFDYSKVALIITKEHEKVVEAISKELDRGATYLQGEGTYSHQEFKVILSAVKRHQIATLKLLVMEIDPDAFIIVQEAHQVLGDGFARYTKDSL